MARKESTAATQRLINYLEKSLMAMENLADKAEKAKSWQPAYSARSKCVDIYYKLQAARLSLNMESLNEDPLLSVRRMRMNAEAERSYVAASNLIKLEMDITEARRLAALAERQTELEAKTTAQLIEKLARNASRLPPALRDRLIASLQSASASSGAEQVQ